MLELFGEVGAFFSLQLSSQTQFAEIKNKKVISQNQCEKKKMSLDAYKKGLDKQKQSEQGLPCLIFRQAFLKF